MDEQYRIDPAATTRQHSFNIGDDIHRRLYAAILNGGFKAVAVSKTPDRVGRRCPDQ